MRILYNVSKISENKTIDTPASQKIFVPDIGSDGSLTFIPDGEEINVFAGTIEISGYFMFSVTDLINVDYNGEIVFNIMNEIYTAKCDIPYLDINNIYMASIDKDSKIVMVYKADSDDDKQLNTILTLMARVTELEDKVSYLSCITRSLKNKRRNRDC